MKAWSQPESRRWKRNILIGISGSGSDRLIAYARISWSGELGQVYGCDSNHMLGVYSLSAWEVISFGDPAENQRGSRHCWTFAENFRMRDDSFK